MRSNSYRCEPVDPVVSVVDPQAMADWLVIDAADPLIPMLGITATSQVIEYLQLDLLARDRILTYPQWPYEGTAGGPALSRPDARLGHVVELPYAGLLSVSDVEVGGEASTDYEEVPGLPARLSFHGAPYSTAEPSLVVHYRAGFGEDIEDVPEQIRAAALMLAAFLYEHRGQCDANEALVKSGAKSVLLPFKAKVVSL